MTSGRTLSPFSQALWAGADNLLDKAAIALRQQDGERADRLVSRAASLPFDEHEESFPAALAVHLRLFSAVVEEMEESDVDDWGWLDAAVEVLRTGDEYARADLRDVLVAVDHDYDLPAAERRRLRAAVAGVPEVPELRDQNDLTTDELAARVGSILRACLAYEDAVS